MPFFSPLNLPRELFEGVSKAIFSSQVNRSHSKLTLSKVEKTLPSLSKATISIVKDLPFSMLFVLVRASIRKIGDILASILDFSLVSNKKKRRF